MAFFINKYNSLLILMKSFKLILSTTIFVFLMINSVFAGVVYQNFETNNGLPVNVWPVGSSGVGVVGITEAVHSGLKSLKVTNTGYWAGVGVGARNTGYLDIKQVNNDRLTFWIYALPSRVCYIYGCGPGMNNTVGVTFYDNNLYQSTGVEVWTTQTANYSSWSKLKVLFSQLPSNFDLRHVTKIEFKNYMLGNYYFDDIQVERSDRVYQNFEKQERSGSTDSEYGWKWNDVDMASISAGGDPVLEGSYSWKLVSIGNWSGTGIQSADKKYNNVNGVVDQSFWHVDLAPENNDRLTFWVYADPSNKMDNNVSVQFYDNGAHSTDATHVVYWPKTAVTSGKWTRVNIPFAELKKIAPDLNLSDINHIQFQNYWPGTFYFDDVRATGPIPKIKQVPTAGSIQWDPVAVTGAKNYRLQESPTGEEGTWKTIYLGSATTFILDHISKNFFRVRWEELVVNKNTVPYFSPWSDTMEFLPPSVVFNYKNIQIGQLTWSALPQVLNYEIQSASSKFGPWSPMYNGPFTTILTGTLGKWYRIRAVQAAPVTNVITGLTPWSRPQQYNPNKGFVKAVGTVLKDGDGTGNILVLNGVNLGGVLVNEPWMTGIGMSDTPTIDDDWSLRNQLKLKFGVVKANTLLQAYQESYLNSFDFDWLLKQDISLVRLPFYYRNLQDDNGNWIRDANGQIDFSVLDRIVNAFSDRGIYVVLDLHGAPGLQSADANTGRKNINKLFAPDGEVYRLRTIALWKQVAQHFKNNPLVMGYDLLNEPVGAAPNNLILADLYDRIYKGIRSVDGKHLIIMEGIWYTDSTTNVETADWGTLPYPQVRGWVNVMYQFHFYHWNYLDADGKLQKADENYPSHVAFIDDKIAKASKAQPLYNVPVMVGEFYGFGIKDIWDYYIQKFNAQKWSWTSWSYKYHDSPSNWGLVNHVNYDEDLPSVQKDSYAVLLRKLQKYVTNYYHTANVTLQNIISSSCRSLRLSPATTPYIFDVSSLFVEPGQEFVISGKNFGSLSSSSAVLYNNSPVTIVSWSDTSIRVRLSSNQVVGSAPVVVRTVKGLSNGINIIVVLHDPSLDPTPSTSTGSNAETFYYTYERCNGRPLGTHGCV